MYLAKVFGAKACHEFRVGYYHYEVLTGELAAIRRTDYKQYQKKLRSIIMDLVILDDFLLQPITEDDEVKRAMSCQDAVLSVRSVSKRHGYPY